MTRTKHTGIYYRDNLSGDRVFYIQYKNPNGKLVRQKVGTKSEGITPTYCKKLREQTLVKLRLGEDAPIQSRNTVRTLGEVATEFFERDDLKTKNKLRSLYNTHLSSLENEPLTYFDKDAIDKFINAKLKEKSKKTKRILSTQTVSNIVTILSAILHWAKDEKGYINIVPSIKRKRLKTDNVRDRYLTIEEIQALYREIETGSLVRKRERLLLFVKLSLVTGGRLGSILGIRGKDINRTNRSVQLYNYKTDKTYTAFLPTNTLALIPPLEPQQKLFDISDPKQIQRPLQRIMNKLFNTGLNPEDRKDRVVIHTLRHTFASHLAINGTSIYKIKKLMDHSDIKMTMRYAKLMPDSGRDDVEALYG